MFPKKIKNSLMKTEKEHGVRILYACESGSRAWGFASKDSDYDVRFIFVRRKNDYLSIEDCRDVIENPISGMLDVTGWDLKKTLRLFKGSNPSLLEWLASPIVYHDKFNFAVRAKNLIPYIYSQRTCFYHYLHMALRNKKAYFQGDTVSAKKYFYVMRPILACQWIERSKKPVPMQFQDLLKLLTNKKILVEIKNLLQKKKDGYEFEKGARNKILDKFIELELARLKSTNIPEKVNANAIKLLDDLFRQTLDEVWKNKA